MCRGVKPPIQKGRDRTKGRKGEPKLSLEMSYDTNKEWASKKKMITILFIPFTQSTSTRAMKPSTMKLIPY